MNRTSYQRFYLWAMLGLIATCAYPIYMGVKVVIEMLQNGVVPLEGYPKYIIPYTPLAVALLLGAALLPLLQRYAKRWDFCLGASISTAAFFALERVMETGILVQGEELAPLESWQMALCYVPPEEYRTRTWEAVDVLLGGYSPAFKLHFYLISIVLLVSMLNCLYGFARMVRTGDCRRKKVLAVQAGFSLAFLGMCIWACFTSFYRTGEITVSLLSAVLMAVFFSLLGITVGLLLRSHSLGKGWSVWLSSAVAAAVTLCMYLGEMILLSGNLYRFGEGFLFDGLGALVLAPIDLLIILATCGITALLCAILKPKN